MLDLFQVFYPTLIPPPRGILDDAAFDERDIVGVDELDRLDLILAVVTTADLRVECAHASAFLASAQNMSR